MAHPTIVGGARRRCPALPWVQHSPLGRNQHATRCYVFRLFPKFAAPCFRRKLMCSIKLRLFLSALGWTATLDITLFSNSSCAVIGHVAYSPKNRLFEPVSGRFAPIRPTNPRRQRNGLPTLATVLSPPAPRPTSGVRLCVGPPPLATACHRQPSSPSTPVPAAEAEDAGSLLERTAMASLPLSRFVIGNSPWRRFVQDAAHLGIGPPGSYHRVYDDKAGLDGWLGTRS